MGHDLVLTEQALGSAASRIDALVADLEASSERREELLAGVGDSWRTDELRAALTSFDSTWRVRREGLQESLAALAGVLRQIDSGFDDADRSLYRTVVPTRGAAGPGREVV